MGENVDRLRPTVEDEYDDTTSEGSTVNVDPKDEAVDGIEALVLSFLTQLDSALKPEETQEVGSGPTRSKKKIELRIANRTKQARDGTTTVRALKFPQRFRYASSRPFAQLFRVMDIVHEAVINEVPVTKRDIYYRHASLFKTQATVDRLVDDLAATFNVGRADLNVRASPKGLLCGSCIQIRLEDGNVITPSDSEACLIPHAEDIAVFDVDPELSWVLIVEKEAVFQTLCSSEFTRLPEIGRGIILTGKGFPDVATRVLVKTLASNLPETIPIMALVDGDPSGLSILSTYMDGSTAMQHENDKLAAGKRIKWVGIHLSELSRLGVGKDSLLPMTSHDEKKAMSMLLHDAPPYPDTWRKELVHMLHTRRKAEIEILASAHSDNSKHSGCPVQPLLSYLVNKISLFSTNATID
ncbi:DNA topoisomerase IV, alpha subunit [Thelephora ganbajun]|uniref:DNA topoisomerase IV, alpha subunit n=1 Tax=Thelephora ganbajun TaxID=370292 RepID=A0ACB6ZBB5_THEGA|nr:DNA topoisomerase IV, alpha subunit [Thelephora ganbajun]